MAVNKNPKIQKHIESKVFDEIKPLKNPEPKFLAGTQPKGTPFKLGIK